MRRVLVLASSCCWQFPHQGGSDGYVIRCRNPPGFADLAVAR